MNVVDYRLFCSLTRIGEFNHVDHTTSVVEAVKQLMF
jgi:hypothetical protein